MVGKKNFYSFKPHDNEEISLEKLGDKYIDQGDYNNAKKAYTKAIKLNPTSSSTFNKLGKICTVRGESKESIDFYEKSLSINANQSDVWLLLAKSLNEFKEYEKALKACLKSISIEFLNVDAHFLLSLILINLNRHSDAEIVTRKVIKMSPNIIGPKINLSLILKNLDQLDEAEKIIRDAIQENPESIRAKLSLIEILVSKGDLNSAESQLRSSILSASNDERFLTKLSDVLIKRKKFVEAEKILLKLIKTNPQDIFLHSSMTKVLISLGDLDQAEKFAREAIKNLPNNAILHLNLGVVLMEKSELVGAESEIKIAQGLDSSMGETFTCLGNIYAVMGKMQISKKYFLKAKNFKSEFAKVQFYLSLQDYHLRDNSVKEEIFNIKDSNINSDKDLIYLNFARSNVLHKQKNYQESTSCLQKANNLKLNLYPSDKETRITTTNSLREHSENMVFPKEVNKEKCKHIFIVGMPRSGSTLLETILSMNPRLNDLGENPLFELSYKKWKSKKLNPDNQRLEEIYSTTLQLPKQQNHLTTNKFLQNYMYSGVIACNIPSARIIHCYRHPLDNILSMYRANFAKGHRYTSSLLDCSDVLLNQSEVMQEYKIKYKSFIYEFNYDKLVLSPEKEIKSLINWLNWEWNESYLNPHSSERYINTASIVQVRNPINSKSLGSWSNYKLLLSPIYKKISESKLFVEFSF